MNDDFNRKLWKMAVDSPDLQEALIKSMNTESGGYSIPTGDITLSVFDKEDTPQREKMLQAIQKASELRVKDLARILGELRVDLTLEEVQGRKLDSPEETLRDIDITALATWALIKWLARKPIERS